MAYDFVRGLIDVRSKLARSTAAGHGPQKREPLSAKVGVVAHYNGPACPNTWQQIVNDASYHVNKDWGGAYGDGLMYHVAIGPNGEKWLCRDLEAVLWHVGAWPENGTWWAIAFPVGEGQRATPRQIQAGAEVASDLLAYSKRGREYLKGHKEISASSCPGSLMQDFVLPYRAGKLGDAPKPPTPPAQPGTLYRVRCGSFREAPNADALVARLKKSGFTALAINEGNARNVYAGSFSVRTNADALVGELKRKGYEAVVIEKGAALPKPPIKPAPAPKPAPSKPAPTKRVKRTASPGSGSYVKAHPTHHSFRPDVLGLVLKYEGWWLAVYLCTYYRHPPVYGRKWEFVSYDVWDKKGRGYALNKTLGWQIVRAIMDDPAPPPIAWLLYDGWMWTPGGGWEVYAPDEDGSDPAHRYHIHVSSRL